MKYPKNSELIYKLWKIIPKKRKGQIKLLIILMVMSSFAEALSLGAILPFLGILTSPELLYKFEVIKKIISFMNIKSLEELRYLFTIAFITAAIISGGLRLITMWITIRLSFAVGSDIGTSAYKNVLFQSYSKHLSQNSSEVISNLFTNTLIVVNNALFPALIILSSFFIFISLIAALAYVSLKITLLVVFGFGIFYLIIILSVRRRVLARSEIISVESIRLVKILQESLGGIRDIILNSNQNFYNRIFREYDNRLKKAQATNIFVGQSPRYLMETVGIILIAVLSFHFTSEDGSLNQAIPLLGTLALAAQRLLPIMQQTYNAWSNISGSKNQVIAVIALLDDDCNKIEIPGDSIEEITFGRFIELNDIFFRYAESENYSLKNISIEIKKGSKIGFVGETGSGKSTLLDIIMGLLEPTKGSVLIDDVKLTKLNNQSWRGSISHVPQNIYLADASIRENIAFGLPEEKIDDDRVIKVSKIAQLHNTVLGLQGGYNSTVGERGIQLSGGECQRIGIARALYKESEVLILDEATSALDIETERKIMNSINELYANLTIIMVAHRLVTLEECQRIFEIKKGQLIEVI